MEQKLDKVNSLYYCTHSVFSITPFHDGLTNYCFHFPVYSFHKIYWFVIHCNKGDRLLLPLLGTWAFPLSFLSFVSYRLLYHQECNIIAYSVSCVDCKLLWLRKLKCDTSMNGFMIWWYTFEVQIDVVWLRHAHAECLKPPPVAKSFYLF